MWDKRRKGVFHTPTAFSTVHREREVTREGRGFTTPLRLFLWSIYIYRERDDCTTKLLLCGAMTVVLGQKEWPGRDRLRTRPTHVVAGTPPGLAPKAFDTYNYRSVVLYVVYIICSVSIPVLHSTAV